MDLLMYNQNFGIQWTYPSNVEARVTVSAQTSVQESSGASTTPIATNNATPLYCNTDVISAMGKIWGQSSNGASGVEASFRLDGTTSSYSIVFSPFTNQRNSQSLTIIPGTTFAIFHVHPNTGSWQPSTPQNNARNGLGDTGIADTYNIQMYVVSRNGLGYYNPETRGPSTLVRSGISWMTSCGD